jgi:hypothetical protein
MFSDTYPKVSADSYLASLANFARRPQVLIFTRNSRQNRQAKHFVFAADFHLL